MSADTSRWPNLRGQFHPKLDWVVTVYEADKVRQMADAAEKGEWNIWTKSTVELLRVLADSPAALAKLNHTQPTIPGKVMALNRAVHYLVRLELWGVEDKGRVHDEVAERWNSTSETLRRDVRDRGDEAREVIAALLATIQTARPNQTREDLLDAFDKDMWFRAPIMVSTDSSV